MNTSAPCTGDEPKNNQAWTPHKATADAQEMSNSPTSRCIVPGRMNVAEFQRDVTDPFAKEDFCATLAETPDGAWEKPMPCGPVEQTSSPWRDQRPTSTTLSSERALKRLLFSMKAAGAQMQVAVARGVEPQCKMHARVQEFEPHAARSTHPLGFLPSTIGGPSAKKIGNEAAREWPRRDEQVRHVHAEAQLHA